MQPGTSSDIAAETTTHPERSMTMDLASIIVSALVHAIVNAGLQATSVVAKDGYESLKAAILRKYGPQVQTDIEKLEQDPTDQGYRDELAQKLRDLGTEDDTELQELAVDLLFIIETLTPVDRIERAQRKAGIRAVDLTLQRHVGGVLDARSHYSLDDRELLTSSIARQSQVPQAVREEIAGLHSTIRDQIETIATQIENSKYKDAETAIANLPLSYVERQRAANLIRADKHMHVSYQALKITVEYFSELNQSVLQSIEREVSPQREANMMLGNAIMIYELTDFVIRYIEAFMVNGTAEIEKLHCETKEKIAELQRQQSALEQLANSPGVEPAVRDQTLADIQNREAAIEELKLEWDKYITEVKALSSTVGEVREKLPTLEVIRENAKVQINLIQLVAMLQFLKQNSNAIKGTIDALKGFRLAPLSPNRVRRLLGI
jgi:hypothetical protein